MHRDLAFYVKILGIYAFAVTLLNLALVWRVDALNDQIVELNSPAGGLRVGQKSPPFSAASISGESIRIHFGEAEPRRILIFARSSCQFSRESFPLWGRLALGLSEHPLIGIVTDGEERARELARDFQPPFPLATVSERTFSRFNVAAVPQTWVVGSDGTVLFSHVGLVDVRAVDAIRGLLLELPSDAPIPGEASPVLGDGKAF